MLSPPPANPSPVPSPNGGIGASPAVDIIPSNGDTPVGAPDPPAREGVGALPTGGRGPDGHFVRGNRGGTGNPHAKQVAKLRSALIHTITEEDVQNITRKLRDQALAGDLDSIRLLLDYTVGKPGKALDPDDVENGVDLFRRLDDMPSVLEALRAMFFTVTGAVLAELVDHSLSNQNVENVMNRFVTDQSFRAQIEEARRRRTRD